MINKTILSFVMIAMLVACSSDKDSAKKSEEELLRLNRMYDSAIVHNDTGILKRLYADDYVFTNPDGKLLTRDQQLNSILTSEIKWESGSSSDVKVRFYDHTAVMTGVFSARGTYRGNPVEINERYTAFWIRKGDNWQMVAEQGNVVK